MSPDESSDDDQEMVYTGTGLGQLPGDDIPLSEDGTVEHRSDQGRDPSVPVEGDTANLPPEDRDKPYSGNQ